MSLVRQLLFNTLFVRSLIIILVFQSMVIAADATPSPYPSFKEDQKCKEIDISFEVTNDPTASTNHSIKLDMKEVKSTSVIISLVGPKKLFLQDIKESEIKNLSKGTYSLVIVGREESSGYCPKQFQVIIK
jgi:hypothetical protein